MTFSLGTLFFCGLLYHTQRRHVVKDTHNDDGEQDEQHDEIHTQNSAAATVENENEDQVRLLDDNQ